MPLKEWLFITVDVLQMMIVNNKCHDISIDRSFITSIRLFTMEVHYPSPAEFEALGQQLAGYTISTSNKIKRHRFVSFFGIEPLIVSILWSMLVDAKDEIMVSFTFADTVKPVYLLWALLFLKCYNTNTRNAAIAGVDEKTFRHWSWIQIKAIANLDQKIVSTAPIKSQYYSAVVNHPSFPLF